MDRSIVDILWLSEAFGGARSGKFDIKLGFPRDGTCRDNPGRDVLLSLCPGTKKKSLSQCPFVPGQGQEQKFQDKLLCPGTKLIKDFQRK